MKFSINVPHKLAYNEESLIEFFDLMYQRQEIWWNKTILKLPQPWGVNPILNNYRFTNIYRELDRASQYVIKNVITRGDLTLPDKLLRNIVFRFFNQPDTFEKHGASLELYQRSNPKIQFEKLLNEIYDIRNKGINPWHTAYMMNLAFANKEYKTYNFKYKFKDWAYTQVLFPEIQKNIPGLLSILRKGEAEDIVKFMVKQFPGVSDFTATEFYLDFCLYDKYDHYIMPYNENSFVNAGPGCQVGLKMIFPDIQKKQMNDVMFWMRDVSKEVFTHLGYDFKYVSWNKTQEKYTWKQTNNFTAHQIEFWLCEYQKYVKMKEGFGKQRSKYKPHK